MRSARGSYMKHSQSHHRWRRWLRVCDPKLVVAGNLRLAMQVIQ